LCKNTVHAVALAPGNRALLGSALAHTDRMLPEKPGTDKVLIVGADSLLDDSVSSRSQVFEIPLLAAHHHINDRALIVPALPSCELHGIQPLYVPPQPRRHRTWHNSENISVNNWR